MATRGAPKPEGWFGLTLNEARLIVLGQMCCDSTGKKVDYEKIAVRGGYKNAASAMTVYRNAKRRLAELSTACPEGSADAANTSTAATPLKTPTKRKRGKAADATPDDMPATPSGTVEAEAAVTPKPKRVRKTPAKKAAAPKVVIPKVEEGDSDGEASMQLESSPLAQASAQHDEGGDLYKRIKEEQSTLADIEEETMADILKEHITASDEERVMASIDVAAEMEAMESVTVPVKTEE
ncbi:putative histone h1.3 [Aspergillus fijiensis CBS 313.89]|uniref:Uncharacterized protein n=1 Tax=Aspergillus fijiensis CBS 313.89 TaxID=1448319 RepID=A0A8G1RXB5_9EURO|nr:uncharacterized protein BO72DRAFT_456090 [Aspergillus fijiensis CBS 313.89]RAK80594.1 hypothetical protein BO72DRAFT_456090 [Aspergillus fijiensis CBS 313.89]